MNLRRGMLLSLAMSILVLSASAQTTTTAPATTQAASQPTTAPAGNAKEISVTARVFDLQAKSDQPIRTVQMTVPITTAQALDRPFRETDPYGPIYRIEYRWNGSNEPDFWFFVIKLWGKQYNIDYAGQAIQAIEADSPADALDRAMEWLKPELSAQYSTRARQRSQPTTAPAGK